VELGPGASATIWADEGLQGVSMTLRPDTKYPGLINDLSGRVESLEVRCTSTDPPGPPAGR